MKTKLFYVMVLVLSLVMVSCESHEPQCPNSRHIHTEWHCDGTKIVVVTINKRNADGTTTTTITTTTTHPDGTSETTTETYTK